MKKRILMGLANGLVARTVKRIPATLIALAVVFAFAVPSHAGLIVRGTDTLGKKLIYDTNFDITWYDYSNAYDTWYNQMAWADALTVDFGGTVYDDWRLPAALNPDGSGPCYGENCTGSEMGHLYYTELGNIAHTPVVNTSPFTDLQLYGYWSGTEYTPYNTDTAWYFHFGNYGSQYYDVYGQKNDPYYALAVRPGDVSAVPVPSALWLFGSGVLGLLGLRKRKKGGRVKSGKSPFAIQG